MPQHKKRKTKKTKKKSRRKPSMAERADLRAVYQDAVQSPEVDVEFYDQVYRQLRGRRPKTLKEDFCGTALLATEWLKSGPQRKAIGVDFDQSALDWCLAHNLNSQGPGLRRRLHLICANVLDVTEPKVDVTCAMNFSFFVFKSREELRRYFEVVYQGLKGDGVFITELYGGTEAIVEIEDEREEDDFTYIWDQERYNPITHETLCHIHFEFEDGSRLDRAYTYDWRLWTIPEVREVLREVGFRRVDVYWDRADEDADDSDYQLTEEEENQEGWLVYVVAAK